LLPAKAWVSLDQWLALLATTHSLQAKVVAALVSALGAHAQLVTAVLVRPVPEVHVQEAVLLALVSAAVLLALVSAVAQALVLRVLVASVLLVLAVAQVVAAAVTAAALPVRSVRAEAREPRRLASQSARNAKSLNREWHRALVAQSFHEVTARPLSACVVVRAFRTSPTRLRPLRLS
jgi:hypothetical protein